MPLPATREAFLTPVLIGAMVIALALPATVFFAFVLQKKADVEKATKEANETQTKLSNMQAELETRSQVDTITKYLEDQRAKVEQAICQTHADFQRAWTSSFADKWQRSPSFNILEALPEASEPDACIRPATHPSIAPYEITQQLTVRTPPRGTADHLVAFLDAYERVERLPFFTYVQYLDITTKNTPQTHLMTIRIVIPLASKAIDSGSGG